jgi:hypothetical protein
VFGSSYDFILEILAKIVEIITVTCNTHNEIPVSLRMFLGILQSIHIHNIELNMMAIKTEI